MTITVCEGAELAEALSSCWIGRSAICWDTGGSESLDVDDGGLPPEQASTVAVTNSTVEAIAARSIIGLDPASLPEVQAQVVVGEGAARMHRIVRDSYERFAGVHAVERSDRVETGGIFVSSPAF